jgi:Flp pilus assembly protein TadD
MEYCGKAQIAGDHQHQPAIPAHPCHCLSERRAVRILIMAKYDPGEATRQAGDRPPWVPQAAIIGEQPQRRQWRRPVRGRTCPGNQARREHGLVGVRRRHPSAVGSEPTMSKRKHAIEVHFQQGVRLHRAGRLAEAEQVYRQVLAAAPTHAETLHMLGVLALQSGQAGAALASIDRAIALRPAIAMYHVNRANALLALGDKAAAVAACHEALRHKRNCAEAGQVLGHALADQGKTDAAIEAYRAALRHDPNLPGLHNNLGLALRQAGQLEDAATHLRQALAHEPSDVQAQSNLAGLLKELGRLDEAEALYRDALRQRPDEPGLHYNLGLVLLLAGRLDEGWPDYEWRFRAGTARIPDCAQPRWQGEPLNGRTLLVRAEQGFGDTIQFCRFMPMVTGGHVILEVQPPLRRLVAGLQDVEQIVGAGEPLPDFDLYVPLLSLPHLLGFPPVTVPYLCAEPQLIAAWRERLDHDGFKVGIAWQGNPASQAELGRSCPLEALRPLAALPGVRLISLQKHYGLEQLATATTEMRLETPQLDAGPDAFVDTAAVMACLDLIVTSDTSIAHLAGALGRPVWVALQHGPDWRWQLGREDCPWYPSMRLFRQTRRGDWDDVFARIAAAAADLVPA